jgi:hypothetical protein
LSIFFSFFRCVPFQAEHLHPSPANLGDQVAVVAAAVVVREDHLLPVPHGGLDGQKVCEAER